MSEDTFLLVFLGLAVGNLYFSMVQRSTVLISRMDDAPQLAGYLNPKFIRLGILLALIKWGWVLYWAFVGSTSIALISLFLSWLAAVILPVPASITLPAIRNQISLVRELDGELGEYLATMTDQWEEYGSRR